MKIAHEEIFGPILPIFGYGNIDDAITYVNARPRPLALHYFGGDDADRRKVLDRTTSGNVTINGTIMHVAQDDLPFGGVGASGMGAYPGYPSKSERGRLPEGVRRVRRSGRRPERSARPCGQQLVERCDSVWDRTLTSAPSPG